MSDRNITTEQRVPDKLLQDYLRPWYAAKSITIYVDIKRMARELLERRAADGSKP